MLLPGLYHDLRGSECLVLRNLDGECRLDSKCLEFPIATTLKIVIRLILLNTILNSVFFGLQRRVVELVSNNL
jgi:hypothetical protein